MKTFFALIGVLSVLRTGTFLLKLLLAIAVVSFLYWVGANGIVRVPVEVIKIKEVIKYVPVETIKTEVQIKEVEKKVEVPVPYIIEREIVREVPKETIKEVIKEVPVEKRVIQEVISPRLRVWHYVVGGMFHKKPLGELYLTNPEDCYNLARQYNGSCVEKLI